MSKKNQNKQKSKQLATLRKERNSLQYEKKERLMSRYSKMMFQTAAKWPGFEDTHEYIQLYI